METRTRSELLSAADEILRKPNLSREDSARVENLIALADETAKDELRRATMADRARELGSHLETPDKDELRRATMATRERELGRRHVETPKLETAEANLPEGEAFRYYLTSGRQSAKRAQAVGTDSAGGYITPQSFSDSVEVMLRKTDGLFDAATLFEPTLGTAINYPILEDSAAANAATVVSENNTSVAGPDLLFADVAFGRVTTWRSGLIRASVELVGDSQFNFEKLLARAIGVRFASGIGASFVSTLLTQATSGLTAASPTAVAGDELYSLIDSVDESYQNANASWLMRRSTLTAIRKLKASTGGDYLFPEARDSAGFPLLLGYRVYICPSMGALSTGAKPISFGDHSRFVRRQVRNSLVVKTYVERYAEFGQIAYEGYVRSDGALLKTSTTNPVKFLTMA
ncbi:MAG: phage major capsid protein [Terriglobales bacterium]